MEARLAEAASECERAEERADEAEAALARLQRLKVWSPCVLKRLTGPEKP